MVSLIASDLIKNGQIVAVLLCIEIVFAGHDQLRSLVLDHNLLAVVLQESLGGCSQALSVQVTQVIVSIK